MGVNVEEMEGSFEDIEVDEGVFWVDPEGLVCCFEGVEEADFRGGILGRRMGWRSGKKAELYQLGGNGVGGVVC